MCPCNFSYFFFCLVILLLKNQAAYAVFEEQACSLILSGWLAYSLSIATEYPSEELKSDPEESSAVVETKTSMYKNMKKGTNRKRSNVFQWFSLKCTWE